MLNPPENLKQFASLIQVVKDLRSPDGCPWDKEQTHASLTRHAVEECYEFIDAIERKNIDDMKDELGDVLLQVLLHAQIADENGNFNINDVIEAINSKMIRRHPHVYSHSEVENSDEVLINWEEIKKKEKRNKPKPTDRFDIPKGLAPLIRSLKFGEKAAKQKFDWENSEQVIDKIKEETAEVVEAIAEKNKEEVTNEIGDLLFATCQLARKLQINPEEALQRTNNRFEKRFFKMKKLIETENKDLNSMSLDEMESYWQRIKK